MKLFRCSYSLFCAGVAIALTSCGSGGNEKTSSADSTAAADSAAKAKAASTIVTTPMNVVTVTHKVADYAKWLTFFEAHDSDRLAAGMHNYVIGRGVEDSNMVLVVLKVDDTAKAKAFTKMSAPKETMKKAGVLGATTINIMTETWQDTVNLPPMTIRSETSLTVKDWDVFLKAFEEGRQERMDNGIADRVVAHEVDDNKKVLVVTALTDTAKAFAYYKSDALMKRHAAEGLVGEPTRLRIRIVKMY